MTGLAIAPADAAGLAVMADWAAAEGWNPGLGDTGPFLAADPGGFLIARLDGEPVACISVVTYGPAYGFLGFYICRAEFRGRGFGWATWGAGMARLGDRTVGLDGVVAQQANYAKSGFVLAHRSIRHAGTVAAPAPSDPRLRAPGPEDRAALAAYDRAAFGFDRPGFRAAWTDGSEGRVTRLLVEDGRVVGYGTIRPCRSGYKIGPLFADDAAGAEALFLALAAEAGGATIALDTPAPNAAAVALAERHGLTPVFETARMYRGSDPGLPLARIFGITTFELG